MTTKCETAHSKSSPAKSSLRNNFIISFFVLLSLSGILTNLIFQNFIYKILVREGISASVIENISRHFAIIGSGITITGIIVILCVAYLISGTITGPLSRLTSGMIEFAKGKWSTRIHVKSNDEVSQLAANFNFMADRIEGALRELKRAMEYTDNIVSTVPSTLVVVSNHMNVLSFNRAFEKMQEQFPSLSMEQFMKPLDQEIRKNLETGQTMKKEFVLQPENSDISLIFSAVISKIGDTIPAPESDEQASVLLTITDITERRKMKEMVLQSKQDWEDTFDAIPDMITIHDRDFNIIQANKAAHDQLNLPFLSPGRINKCFRYYHGSESAPPGCPSCNCMVTREPASFEVFEPFLGKYIEIRSIPRLNNKDEFVGLIHIVRDITERKQIEDEHNQLLKVVTRAKIEWEVTFDTVNEFIILVDKEFTVKRCNKSFAEYTGLTAGILVNKKGYDFFTPSDPAELQLYKEMVAREEEMDRREVKTEDDHWFYVSQRPIRDRGGKYMHTVIIATDITDLKNTQQKLKQSEQDLKKQVTDLENFYEMAVGREMRMKDLKKEIKKLNDELSVYKDHEPIHNRA